MSTPVLTLDQRVDLARAIWARAQGEPVTSVGLTLHRTLDARWAAIVGAPDRDRSAFGTTADAAVDALLAAFACDAAEAA